MSPLDILKKIGGIAEGAAQLVLEHPEVVDEVIKVVTVVAQASAARPGGK